jgi:hypothetical protein
MLQRLKRHPVVAAFVVLFVFVFWSFPQWLGTVWPLFTDKKLTDWIDEHRLPGMTASVYGWFTIVVGLLLMAGVGAVIWLQISDADSGAATSPVAAPATSDPRLETMKRLLNEASAEVRRSPRNPNMTMDEVSERALMYLHVVRFLNAGFAHYVRPDFDRFMDTEREKWQAVGDFDAEHTMADYLDRLSARLTPADLDPGFVLPLDYQQFRKTEPWPANVRRA